MPTIHEDALRSSIIALLHGLHVPVKNCRIVADHVVEASLQGLDSHGVSILPRYFARVRRGIIEPRSTVRVAHRRGCTALVDGGFNFGQVAMVQATKLAVRMARSWGVGVVSVRNIDHIGIARYYAVLAAKEGMVAMVMTNAGPSMAPPGGAEPVVGTNPIAIGVPMKDSPLILDMATSVSARAKIHRAKFMGVKIPAGWALGPDGKETTDPELALAGSLVPIGGYKGFGLAMMIDLLTGGLANSAVGRRVVSLGTDENERPNVSALVMCLKVSVFAPYRSFLHNAFLMVNDIKSCRKAEGVDETFVPGEPEMRIREQRLHDGIPIDQTTWNELGRWSDELHLVTSFSSASD